MVGGGEGYTINIPVTVNVGRASEPGVPSPTPKPVEEIEKDIRRMEPHRIAKFADEFYRMSRIYAPFLRYIPGLGPQLAATAVGIGRGFVNMVAGLRGHAKDILSGFGNVGAGLGKVFTGQGEKGFLQMKQGFGQIASAASGIATTVAIVAGVVIAIWSLSKVFRTLMGTFFQVFGVFLDIILLPMVIIFMPLIRMLLSHLPTFIRMSEIVAQVLEDNLPAIETLLVPVIWTIVTLLGMIMGPVILIAMAVKAFGAILQTIQGALEWIRSKLPWFPFQTGGVVTASHPIMGLLHPGEVVVNPARGMAGMPPSVRNFFQPNLLVPSVGGGTRQQVVNITTNINIHQSDLSHNVPVYTWEDEVKDAIRSALS